MWGQVAAAAITGIGSFIGKRNQNKANEKISQKQMDFQERMSNTAYQRGMDDMKKAGLNPMLAYSQGGANAPGGAGIPAVDELGDGINSARASYMADAQEKQISAQIENIEEQNKNLQEQNKNLKSQNLEINSKVNLNHALAGVAVADAQLKTNSAKSIANQEKMREHMIHGLKAEGDIDKTTYGQWMRYINRLPIVGQGRFKGLNLRAGGK